MMNSQDLPKRGKPSPYGDHDLLLGPKFCLFALISRACVNDIQMTDVRPTRELTGAS
jgi:hypothetical protein